MLRLPALLLALVAGLGLPGCLTAHPRVEAPARPLLLPDRFFDGATHGLGTLTVRGGAPRVVRVESEGREQPDGTFRLDQTIRLGEAEPTTRTWTMRRTGPITYTGTLSDADGPVQIEVVGAQVRIRYPIRKPFVSMRQSLTLQPDGRTVLNLTTVTVLGIPWARLVEQITRDALMERGSAAGRGGPAAGR